MRLELPLNYPEVIPAIRTGEKYYRGSMQATVIASDSELEAKRKRGNPLSFTIPILKEIIPFRIDRVYQIKFPVSRTCFDLFFPADS